MWTEQENCILKLFPRQNALRSDFLQTALKKVRAICSISFMTALGAGWRYAITFADMVYLFYFAVDSAQRGNGLGSQAIKAILDKYSGKRVFLALENWNEPSDNAEQRIKRHSFPQKCGLSDLPYRIKEASMTYSIMGVNGKDRP